MIGEKKKTALYDYNRHNFFRPRINWSKVNTAKTAQYPYAATVRMSCDDGYVRAEGSYALRCLANGRWNDTSLRCTRK